MRQLIDNERRFDYLETICLICWVNNFSHFVLVHIYLKTRKTMKNQNKFVGNSQSFAPPATELNFRHCWWTSYFTSKSIFKNGWNIRVIIHNQYCHIYSCIIIEKASNVETALIFIRICLYWSAFVTFNS